MQVQITRSANEFELVKNSPHNFEISRVDCSGINVLMTCIALIIFDMPNLFLVFDFDALCYDGGVKVSPLVIGLETVIFQLMFLVVVVFFH